MFMGQYDYAVDAKGRLNFPAKFRDGMGETFIVTRWLDHCLAAFPPEEFEKVAQRIAEKGLAGKAVKAVAQLCDGCGDQGVVVKQQVRALKPHVVKLGKILGKHRVFAGRGHFPAKPQMRVGRRHGSHLGKVFSIVTHFR